MRKVITGLAAVFTAVLVLAGCHNGSGSSTPSAFAPASSAEARVSAAASAIPSADVAQAKADLKRCVTGTPLQQIHTVHVVLLESAKGKNGAEVTAARARVLGCLGVPAARRAQFKNDSLAAAEKQEPRVFTKAGIKLYVLVTWPGILARYQQAGSAASPSPGAAGS